MRFFILERGGFDWHLYSELLTQRAFAYVEQPRRLLNSKGLLFADRRIALVIHYKRWFKVNVRGEGRRDVCTREPSRSACLQACGVFATYIVNSPEPRQPIYGMALLEPIIHARPIL